MNRGEEPDSFRHFYNKVFLMEVKDCLAKYNGYGYINPNSTPIRLRQPNLLQRMQIDSPLKSTRVLPPFGGTQVVEGNPAGASVNNSRKGSNLSPISQNLVCMDSPLPSHERGLMKR